MAKDSLPPRSAKKMNRRGNNPKKEKEKEKEKEKAKESKRHCDCFSCKQACFLAGLKDHKNGFTLVPLSTTLHDYKVEFVHLSCGTEIKRMACKDAFDRGVVVVRCSGCDDLIPVADPANWFGGVTHATVDRRLFDYFKRIMLPRGSDFSFCALFGSSDGSTSDAKNSHSDRGVILVPKFGRDATVNFTHVPCRTRNTRKVDQEAFDRGVVVIRCNGCNDLIPVSYHDDWLGEGLRDQIDTFMTELDAANFPPKGSNQPLCAIFRRINSTKREPGRFPPGEGTYRTTQNKPHGGIGFAILRTNECNATIDFIHLRCGTQLIRRVNRKALDEGLVVVRCNGCNELAVIADHGHLVGDGSHDKVERCLSALHGGHIHVPPKGSDSSFCATLENLDWFNRTTGKVQREGADRTANMFGQAADFNNPNAKGDDVIVIEDARDHVGAYTHPACNTIQVRRVCRKALDKGTVLARCSGCNKLFFLADSVGWLGRLHHPSTLENFLSDFKCDIKHGSEETFCVTYESEDTWHGRNQGVRFHEDRHPRVPEISRPHIEAQSDTNGGDKSKVQSGTSGGSEPKAQSGTNGGCNPVAQLRIDRGNNPKEQSGTDGGCISKAQPGNDGGGNPKVKSGTRGGSELKGERETNRGSNSGAQSRMNEVSNLKEQSRADGGSIHKAQPGTSRGSNPKAQSGTNAGSDPKGEQKQKKAHKTGDLSAGKNNTDNGSCSLESNPEFVLVQNGGSNTIARPEVNGANNPKEQSVMNGGSIPKAQPGTNGSSDLKAQSGANGESDPREEQKNKKSKKQKKSQKTTHRSAIENNNNDGSSTLQLHPEFVLVQNGRSNTRLQSEMNGEVKGQSRRAGESIPKAQPGTIGGSDPKTQSGANRENKPQEKQKNKKSKKKSKKKTKSNETTDQSAGANRNNNGGSSSPAFNPELVLVQNSIRDASLDFTHPLCNTQSERLVNMEAFHRGVVVVRCGGCDNLVALADHADWFGEDEEHEKVERFLDFLGVDVPKGSAQSFCATFESKEMAQD